MREIKFRAWDTQAKCMLGGGGMQMNATTGRLDYLPSVIIMQYTGLKDKNGTEIYEGDILRTKRIWSWGNNIEVDIVKWETRYTFNGFWPFQRFNAEEVYAVEIIGNIYENPELLNGGGE